MFATGVVLVDDGTAQDIQREAQAILDAGPPPWTEQQVQFARFMITNHLLDLEGGLPSMDMIFSINELANALHELVLRANGHWIGKGKRIIPALRAYDSALAQEFTGAFEGFFTGGNISEVIRFTDGILESYGGLLFAGYSTKGT